MNDNAYYQRLSADAVEWRHAGLIDAEQEGALKAWADMRRARTAPPFGTLSLLAAAAFIIGALSILAANWARLGDLVQFLIVLAIFNATLIGAGWLLKRQRRILGDAAGLAAAAMFGGALILIGQSFNIAGSAEGLLFIWIFGAGMVALALSTGPALALTVALVFVWMVVRLSANPLDKLRLGAETYTGPLADPGFWLVPVLTLGLAVFARRGRFAVAWHAVQILFWCWLAILFADAFGLASADDRLGMAGGVFAVAGALAALTGFWLRHRAIWGGAVMAGYATAAALCSALAACASLEGGAVYAATGAYLLAATGIVVAGTALHHRWVMALGVAGFLAAAGYLYVRIGGSLLSAGIVLLLTAAGIGALGWLLSRRHAKKGGAS